MIVKTDAIVLRARKLRETSLFLTLYTAAYGKIDVVAKGARTSKSKLRGVLQPFAEISAVLYRKEHRSAQYLSDADVVCQRHRVETDFDALAAAFAVAELTDAMMQAEDTNVAMYALLRDTLSELDGVVSRPGAVVAWFQCRLIAILGFALRTDRCVGCGVDLGGATERWFHVADGGIRCGGCARLRGGGTKISAEAYMVLQAATHARLEQAGAATASTAQAEQELRGLLNGYIMHHTESRAILRSGAMLGSALRAG